MSITSKIDTRTISLIVIALIGGVIGGYLSSASFKDIKIEGLSNAIIAKVDSKDTEIASLGDTISDLEAQLSQIEVTIAEIESVPAIGFNTPDYDSGWIDVQLNHVDIHHNLGTTNLFVYLIGGGPDSPHQFRYGGDWFLTREGDATAIYYEDSRNGAYWTTADENVIRVMVNDHEQNWSEIRTLLWLLPEPPIVMQPVP